LKKKYGKGPLIFHYGHYILPREFDDYLHELGLKTAQWALEKIARLKSPLVEAANRRWFLPA
jgi:hypothetical protein